MSTKTDLHKVEANSIRHQIDSQQSKIQSENLPTTHPSAAPHSEATDTNIAITNKGSSSAVIDGKAVEAPEGDGRARGQAGTAGMGPRGAGMGSGTGVGLTSAEKGAVDN